MLNDSSPVVIPIQEGVNLLPSVVAFSDDGEVTVGAAAKGYDSTFKCVDLYCTLDRVPSELIQAVLHRIGSTRPGSTFASVKRLIGQKAENVKDETALVSPLRPFSLSFSTQQVLLLIHHLGHRPSHWQDRGNIGQKGMLY